jgi:hypothetical protein
VLLPFSETELTVVQSVDGISANIVVHEAASDGSSRSQNGSIPEYNRQYTYTRSTRYEVQSIDSAIFGITIGS